MDTAAIIPLKKHIPTEMIEEILLNLPLKSLLRFSTVSKSWNSMILDDPVFARKHKNRAALLFWHRLVVYVNSDLDEDASFCSLAPISSDLRLEVILQPHSSEHDRKTPSFTTISDTNIDARDYVSQFEGKPYTNIDARDYVGQFEGKPYFLASCDEFWCVEVKKCLYLWNPSMGNIIPLPPPSSFESCADSRTWMGTYIYGLAYDSVNDDYKVLKIGRHSPFKTELYSLKNHCWKNMKNIESFSDVPPLSQQQKCEFVDGKLHWIGLTTSGAPIIASFDVSTEKYGEVAQPQYDEEDPKLEVVSLRGMLCACVSYRPDTVDGRFVLWAMEKYGVEKSWTKKLGVKLSFFYTCPKKLTPLYISDNNDILIRIYEEYTDYMHLKLYRNGEEWPTAIVRCGGGWYYYEADAFLYVESLITHKNFSRNK